MRLSSSEVFWLKVIRSHEYQVIPNTTSRSPLEQKKLEQSQLKRIDRTNNVMEVGSDKRKGLDGSLLAGSETVPR